MRWILPFLFVVSGTALAQEASPLGLTNAIAYRWDDVSGLVAPPDSGAVEDGEGHLAWFDLTDGTARLDVVVAHGSIALVTMTVDRNEDLEQLSTTAQQYAAALGAPADGAFYTAAQLRTANASAPYVDIAFVVGEGKTILRKPSAPPPSAPPPGN